MFFTMNSEHFFKKISFYNDLFTFFVNKHVFFKNVSFYNELCYVFQKHQFFSINIHCPVGSPFWDLFGTGRGQWRSRAEPARAEPSRAELSRAEPEPSRAELECHTPPCWPPFSLSLLASAHQNTPYIPIHILYAYISIYPLYTNPMYPYVYMHGR